MVNGNLTVTFGIQVFLLRSPGLLEYFTVDSMQVDEIDWEQMMKEGEG